jgi:hypothetical protein
MAFSGAGISFSMPTIPDVKAFVVIVTRSLATSAIHPSEKCNIAH